MGDSRSDFAGTSRFEIRRRLGVGGMGVVYEAWDCEQKSACAIKTLRINDPEALYRFKNEFRGVQGISHPNLVRLGELICEDDTWFFTMELVLGDDLLAHVRPGLQRGSPLSGDRQPTGTDTATFTMVTDRSRGVLDEARLRRAMSQLASALHALHSEGKVHRDVKPSNVIVTTAQRLVLLDFGIVTTIDDASEQTGGGLAVGTAQYMAPEQALGQATSASDWYALGVVLYQALTGTLPHGGRTAYEVIQKKQLHAPPPPRARNPDIPEDLDSLCVELLRTDPRKRPRDAEVLDRIGATTGGMDSLRPATASLFTQTIPFVGRTEELAQLQRAYDRSRRGRCATVLVHGESGVGKSELVRVFTDLNKERDTLAVVLSGRCHEQETVPYKALDGVADALSAFMARIPKDESAVLVPLRASLLGQLFPVLKRVNAIAAAPPDPAAPNIQEQRARMFGAFRELITRLAQRRPLILVIDDLQWSDPDSLSLLSELIQPPDEPPLMLVTTIRTTSDGEDVATISAKLGLTDDRVSVIALGELPPDASRQLIARLAPERIARDRRLVDKVAAETQGHPLFIQEILRYLESTGEATVDIGRIGLEDALRARIGELPAGPRCVLEVLAVADAPIEQQTAARASDLPLDDFNRFAAALRVSFLARTMGARIRDSISLYHDRVRDAVLAELDEESQKRLHRQLAIALEQGGASDPSALVRHFERAGDTARAAHHALEAAKRAEAALAFDRAAELYQITLRLGSHDSEQARGLRMQLGATLTNAGRSAEAAEVFAQAGEGADAATRLTCQRHAAEQLLISGHIERGLDAVSALLAEIGVALPSTPRRALLSLLWHRLRLRLRGLGWKERDASQLAPEVLTKLDVFRAVAHGLGVVDSIRGMDFQCKGLLLALQTGEKRYVGRSLLYEAIFLGSQGSRSFRRARVLFTRGREIAERTKDPHVIAWVAVADGFLSYFEGRFRHASDMLEKAEDQFREMTLGTSWEIGSSRLCRTWALLHLGVFGEIIPMVRRFSRDAQRRGDRYLLTTLRRSCNAQWLAAGDPAAAIADLSDADWMPPTGRYHLQHWFELRARAQVSLYRDEEPDDFAQGYQALGRSMLTRIQTVRTESLWLRARIALHQFDNTSSAKVVAKVARRLDRENISYASVWALLLRAGLAQRSGSPKECAAFLATANDLAEKHDMYLCAATARRCRGRILGGSEGNALIADADRWMKEQSISDPDAMSRVIAPGCADST